MLEAAADEEEERQREEKLRKVNEENRLKAQEATAKEQRMTYPYDTTEWVEFVEDGQVNDYNKVTKERLGEERKHYTSSRKEQESLTQEKTAMKKIRKET